jgi:hypothetical protein
MNINWFSFGMLVVYYITVLPIILGYLYWQEWRKKQVKQ